MRSQIVSTFLSKSWRIFFVNTVTRTMRRRGKVASSQCHVQSLLFTLLKSTTTMIQELILHSVQGQWMDADQLVGWICVWCNGWRKFIFTTRAWCSIQMEIMFQDELFQWVDELSFLFFKRQSQSSMLLQWHVHQLINRPQNEHVQIGTALVSSLLWLLHIIALQKQVWIVFEFTEKKKKSQHSFRFRLLICLACCTSSRWNSISR